MELPKKIYSKDNSIISTSKSSSKEYLKFLTSLEENIKNVKQIKSYLNLETEAKEYIFKKKLILSNMVIKEIETLDKSQLLDYLQHRYKYEIFPLEKKLDDYPPYLQIEPSSICNYRCVFCYQNDETFNKRSFGFMGKMRFDLFKNIVDQIVGKIHFVSLASRGEPLLCDDIIKMLEYTENKFYNLKMNTNAYELDEKRIHAILSSGIKTIVFSADEADKKNYEKLRVYGDFDRVMSNIEKFNKIKNNHYKKSKIITRVSGVKISDKQDINEMEKVWGRLVDQVIFVEYCPWTNTYLEKENSISTPCSELWRRMYVWWDGKYNSCEPDYKSLLSPGTFDKISITDAWKSTYMKKIREKHLEKNRSHLEPCIRCSVV